MQLLLELTMDFIWLYAVIFVVTSPIGILAQQNEFCPVGSTGSFVCDSNSRCFTRSRLGEANYVCECTRAFVMGFTCTTPSSHSELQTCYGVRCRSGSFESPNFANPPPNNVYPNLHTQLYLLYIPGATQIQFSFDPTFQVEFFKDELYVGTGLEYNPSQVRNARSEPPDKYFFEGGVRPDDFTLLTDAVWIYFSTDATIQQRGFRLSWSAVDTVAPIVISCPGDITQNVGPRSQGQQAFWTEPTATDDSGVQPVSVSRSHAPGSFFSVNVPTMVTYVFADEAGNRATCSFTVTINSMDDTPPTVQCPPDIFKPVPCCPNPFVGTVVTWTEPVAQDNSGTGVSRISRNYVSGSLFMLGVTTVQYQYRDQSNNVGSCSFTITVVFEDIEPPVVTCPPMVGLVVLYGVTGAIATWDEPTATDNSGVPNLVSQSHFSGTFFPLGQTNVVYTYQDQSGNEGSCSFLVFVTSVDSSNPVVMCPEDIIEEIPLNSPGANVFWAPPTAMDDSGRVFPVSQTFQSGAFFGRGTEIVEYVFQDDRGNVGSCSFTVTVIAVDLTAPYYVDCPADITLQVPLTSGGTTVTWNIPSVSDNSGVLISQSSNFNPGDFFGIGATTVEYTATDEAGNTGRCLFEVAIVTDDDERPLIVCPSDITVSVVGGTQRTPVNWVEPIPTDNSGQAMIIFATHNPGDSFFVGSTQVSYVAQDGFGNIRACSFFVIVSTVDNQGPTVTCPEPISRTVAPGRGGSTVTWREPVTSDDSGGPVSLVSRSSAPGSFFIVGLTTVVYVYADSAGNEGTCSFTVTLTEVDNTPPVANCPDDIIMDLGSSSPGVPVFWPDATATDNSGTVNLISRFPQPGTFFSNPSENVVTYEFSDLAGNRATCTFRVIVRFVDSQPPIVSNCPTDLSTVVPVGTAGGPLSWNEPTAVDNSGNVITSQTYSPGSFFPVGSTTVTYRFTDSVGNVATCVFNILVTEVDNEAPTVTCPRDLSRTISLGTRDIPVFWQDPRVSDNSGTYSLNQNSHNPGDLFQIGITDVTYSYTDNSGNIGACSFTVTITSEDTTNPVVTCPGDITTTTPLGTFGTSVTWTAPTATDDSGQVRLISESLPSGSFFSVGTTTVIYVYQDPSQNTGICYFDITVNAVDETQPQCSVLQDINEVVPLGQRGRSVNFVAPQATDNSGVVFLQGATHSPGAFFEVGPTQVCYTFADPDANSVDCCFMVTVTEVDNTPPQVVDCPGDITENTEIGSAGTVVRWVPPVAFDNAGTVTSQSRYDSGDFFQVGQTQVVYIFSDEAGNTAECIFTITVQIVDTMAPVPDCPGDIQATAGLGEQRVVVRWDEPTATDNAGIVHMSTTHIPGTAFPLGETRVSYTFQDQSNNVATCSFLITIFQVDSISPDVQCPADINEVVPLNTPQRIATWIEPTATDNSGQVTLVSNNFSPGDVFPVGNTIVTYTYRDPTGNTASCSFDVNIIPVDSVPPVVTCPLDVTQTVPFGTTGSVPVTWTAPIVNDDSGQVILVSSSHTSGDSFPIGSETVTYRYQDGSGNGESCSFNVIVMQGSDTEPPVFTNCLTNRNIVIPVEQQTTQVTWNTIATATDNSGPPTMDYISRDPTVNIFPTGPNMVLALNVPVGQTSFSVVATDGSGNTVECAFVVTVSQVDNTSPVVTRCPDEDITRDVDLGTQTVTVTFDTPTATDNNGPVTTENTHFSGQAFPVGVTSVSYVFRDQAGNVATCSFRILVREVDNESPVVTCPADVIEVVPLITQQRIVTWNLPTASDNSGQVFLVSVSNNFSPGDIFPIGNTRVTYTYRDPSFNQGSCSFDVNIIAVDSEPPSLMCPSDVTTTVPFGNFNPASVTWSEPVTSDNSGQVILISRSHNPGDLFAVSDIPTVVTYTYQDGSGNQNSCSFTVTVRQAADNVAPVFTNCPADKELTIPVDQRVINIRWTTVPVATDNSGSVDIVYMARRPGVTLFQSNVNEVLATDVPSGLTTFVATATDSSGNSAECIFNAHVTRVDNVPPQVTGGPADIRETVNLGVPSVVVMWDEPQVTDNGGPVSMLRTHVSGQAFPVGTTTVSYMYIDLAGNVAFHTFNVIVSQVDTEDPMVTCPADVVEVVALNTPERRVSWNLPSATDNSGTVTLVSSTRSPNDMFPVGNTRVTYTYRDPSGNQGSCSFDVIVIAIDSEPPTVTCPPDITQTVPFSNSNPVVVTWPDPTTSDNSGRVIFVSSTHNSGATFTVGAAPTRVTYTYQDGSGNRASCTFTVTIRQTVDMRPDITCPSDPATVVITSGTTGSVNFAVPTATDDSGLQPSIGYTSIPGGVSFFNSNAGMMLASGVSIGRTIVTAVATDGNGNTDMCTFVLTVTSDSPPTINCPPNQSTNPSSTGTGLAFYTFPGTIANDNGGTTTVQYTFDQPGVTYFDSMGARVLVSNLPVGVTTVTATATDSSGQVASCSFTITVDMPPQITCPPNQVFTQQPGQIFVTFPQATATDNGGAVTVIYSSSPPGWAFFVNRATGNIQAFNIQPGTFTISATAIDSNNNRVTCTFTLTIQADAAPVITCPINPAPLLITSGTTGTINFPSATATDDSGLQPNIRYESNPVGVGFFDSNAGMVLALDVPIGMTTVTATATDGNGNTATCTLVLEITINPPPQVLCPPNPAPVTLLSSMGTTTTVTFTRPTASDDGGPPTLGYTSNPVGVSFADNAGLNTVTASNVGVGTTMVTVTATDNLNSQATCTFDLTVVGVDDTPPVVTCPANLFPASPFMSPTAVVSWTEPTVTDNSGQPTILLTRNRMPGDTFPLGLTTVTYIYSDQSGNQGTCSFTISVSAGVDMTEPEVVMNTCPNDIVQLIDINSAPQGVTWNHPQATDNSGQTPVRTATHSSGDLFPLGTTVVTYTFCDSANNCNQMCDFNIVLTEERPIILNCPEGETLRNPALAFGGVGAQAAWGPVDSTGNVDMETHSANGDFLTPGITTVMFSFCNNQMQCTSCSFQVEVVTPAAFGTDNTPPVITGCPLDETRTVAAGTASQLFDWVAPTATDPNGVRSVTDNIMYETQFVGTVGSAKLIDYEFVDSTGNRATCDFTLRVITNNGPGFDISPCPSDITIAAPSGATETTATWIEPRSSTGTLGFQSNNSGATFMTDTTTLVYYRFDNGQERSICDFTVTVTATP